MRLQDIGRQKRRRVSLTSLIDVIFLLLLFFMLSSTFSQYSEFSLGDLAPATAPGSAGSPLFIRVSANQLDVNGAATPLADLPQLIEERDAPAQALISLNPDVSAQKLTDVLLTLRPINGLDITLLD